MREILINLQKKLNHICPSFIQVPPNTPYPYITLEPGQILQGLPWGPSIALINVKIWSNYKGTREILKLARGVDTLLGGYVSPLAHGSLKVLDSSLMLFKDETTRVHTFRLKMLLRRDEA